MFSLKIISLLKYVFVNVGKNISALDELCSFITVP